MALDLIHLSKFLRFSYLPQKRLRHDMGRDIYNDRRKTEGKSKGGPDFFGAFWGDAKLHVEGKADLRDLVAYRIFRNARRDRLYKAMLSGFINWWDNERRWTNEPFQIRQSPTARLEVSQGITLKIENIMSVRDAADLDHYIYPYFSEHAEIDDEAARVGLATIYRALPDLPQSEIRIMDVIHGQVWSADRVVFGGDEEEILHRKCKFITSFRKALEEERRQSR